MDLLELSETAEQICKENGGDCDKCPLTPACRKPCGPGVELFNRHIKTVNDLAESITTPVKTEAKEIP